jgi:hypothetical protein
MLNVHSRGRHDRMLIIRKRRDPCKMTCDFSETQQETLAPRDTFDNVSHRKVSEIMHVNL